MPRVTVLAVPREPLPAGGAPVFLGGLGSAMALDPATGDLLLLTDRGPNVDDRDGKRFLVPGFAPRLVRLRRTAQGLEPIAQIELRAADGRPLTGIPNPPGAGGTGEAAYDADGRPLPFDPAGLDPEGLAVLRDGSFWVADEYGPHLVHFDASGRTLERVSPFGTGRRLPAVLARRRPNRGVEGLAATPDGTTLAALLEAPLDNPAAGGRRSRAVRLVLFEPASGRTRQHAVLLEEPDSTFGALTALSATAFLAVERDRKAPGDPDEPARISRIVAIDVSGASDLSDPDDAPHGRLFGGRTLEELAEGEFAQQGVVPATKTLVVDLLALGYPHDKPEGVALLDATHVAVVNDDDFGVDDSGGEPVPKRLPLLGDETDRSALWVIELAAPLRDGDAR
jgi:hypothetical protein